ncbi:MAG TPA: hypothetical protein VJH70_00200 [Candidatus Paceibacterota bacterium]
MDKQKFEDLVKKIEALKKSGQIDLSLEEDLSIAVMNLVSLEEHYFFTGAKTKKNEYFDFAQEIREMRKQLLGKLISRHEGETWCIAKHLLAAAMRLIEVGTKLKADNKNAEAIAMFEHAYKVYAMFWALRLKVIDASGFKKMAADEKPWSYQDIVDKLVDCCHE